MASYKPAPHRSRRSGSGFTYIGLLLAVAFIGAGLAAIGQVWHTNVQRSREAELLFIGEQFKRAIKLYYDSTPGGDKQLPKSLEDLVRDERYPVVRRYLRKVYADPMRGKAEWGLIKQNNGEGILGVYSLSEGAPFKHRDAASTVSTSSTPKPRLSYADWRFVADVVLAPVAVAAAAAPPRGVIAQPTPAPAPATEPVAAPPELPPAAVPPTSRPKPLPTERCERLREMDARTCNANALRRGSPDSACESSAASRYANCTAGVSAGPLWTAN